MSCFFVAGAILEVGQGNRKLLAIIFPLIQRRGFGVVRNSLDTQTTLMNTILLGQKEPLQLWVDLPKNWILSIHGRYPQTNDMFFAAHAQIGNPLISNVDIYTKIQTNNQHEQPTTGPPGKRGGWGKIA